LVEWRYADDTGGYDPGPVQPEASEVQTSDCAWDGRGSAVEAPTGEVSRADPRWAAVTITCVTGSDGFAPLENPTLLLVGRSGAGGPFTRVAAHAFTSWSSQSNLCARRAPWPVSPAARVALEFCTPFPWALRAALR
jgi:hypothetical protein